MDRRIGRPRPRLRSRGRRALALAVAGLVTLSLGFALGVLVGREWARGHPGVAKTEPARRPAVSARRGLSEAETERLPQIQEKLTFYQTLMAPLASAPPSPKPEAKSREDAPKDRAKGPPDAVAPRHTVQVGAFGSKPPADEMDQKLKDAGYEAYVLAVGGDDSRMTYRVRVGSYATRAEAEQVAVRLREERGLSPFVTIR